MVPKYAHISMTMDLSIIPQGAATWPAGSFKQNRRGIYFIAAGTTGEALGNSESRKRTRTGSQKLGVRIAKVGIAE